jgi:quercetin dioxygenase-like cupin family protein
MNIFSKWNSVTALSLLVVGSSTLLTERTAEPDKPERTRIAFTQKLPQLDGRNLTATVVEVTYGPGESSRPHSHPCAVIGYVLEGELRTQVEGGSEATYKAGESFFEAPNGLHLVSANLSQHRRARFLAYFVCDRETKLSVEAPLNKAEGESKP